MASEATERRGVKQSSNMTGMVITALIALALLGGLGFVGARLFEWTKPTLTLDGELSALGKKTTLRPSIADKGSGLKQIQVILRQDKKETVLFERQLARTSFFSGGPKRVDEPIELDTQALGLADGPAELLIIARDYSLWQWARGNQAVELHSLTLDSKPPRLQMLDSPHLIKQGGAGMVVYGANEPIVRHGITIDGVFHPGYPIPSRKGEVYGAIVALPHDVAAPKSVALTAQDKAGNLSEQPISLRIKPVPKRMDTINLSDNFLNSKIPEFAQHYPEMQGSQVEQYLFVNNEVRNRNNAQIRELCAKTDPERHWQGRFYRMERGAPMAGYAQHRAYIYQGKEIDQQVHLGVDLASLQQAQVEAANNGRVVFADYLGIYGNMVMIDHGQGVFSLYSHLSEIRAKVGEQVKTKDVIGLTGTTGMAGGDHLHFSILVNGVFVTPVEWWDEHWIKDNVLRFLQESKEPPQG